MPVLSRLLLLTLSFVMICTAALAFAVYGAIGDKYTALGRERGPLGPAQTDEAPAPYGGRFNRFQNGYIYWHPDTGAFAVWGAIGAKWNALGTVAYGYPITDELTTPDKRGRFNHFRALQLQGRPEASIYWTPETGAHAVYGAIRQAWAQDGWERGIGYPTSDEYQDGQFRRSDFESGHIIWSASGGAKIVRAGSTITNPPNTFGGLPVNGIEIALKGNPIAGNSTFLSENSICRQWSANLGRLNGLAKDQLRAAVNPQMRGFSIRSDARMSLTSACSFRAEILQACGDTVTLRMALPRNLFRFHVTTPSVFGSWADPEFSVDFDLEARTTVTLPSNARTPLRLGTTTVSASNVRLDSQNVTGDVALAVAKVYQFFTGRDVTRLITQDRSFSFPGVETSLATLNRSLSRIPANYRLTSCVTDGHLLRINGTNEPPPAGPVVH